MNPPLIIQDNQQANIVIKSKNEMTLLERRMVYLIINQLDENSNFKNNEIQNLNFTLPFNLLKETNYERIRNSVSNLPFRTLMLITSNDRKDFKQVTPFPRAKVIKSNIEITLAKNALPHFLNLKNNFTKRQLSVALSLNSIYSQRLYELLNPWKNKQEWVVSLNELQRLFGAENYRPGDFVKKCVEKAILEVNLKTTLNVIFTIRREGRFILGIRFKINSKTKQKTVSVKKVVPLEIKSKAKQKEVNTNQIMPPYENLTPAEIFGYINRLSAYRFTEQQKEKIMASTDLFTKFIKMENQITGGKIKNLLNPTAYMSGFLFLPD